MQHLSGGKHLADARPHGLSIYFFVFPTYQAYMISGRPVVHGWLLVSDEEDLDRWTGRSSGFRVLCSKFNSNAVLHGHSMYFVSV